MTDHRFCTVEDDGRVRLVTINRPEVLNALHSEAHWEFDQVRSVGRDHHRRG
jgi:enoyl-CoA hydratase/carnithine racemase